MVVLFRPYLSEQTSPNVEEKCEEFGDENKEDYQKLQIECKWEDCGKRFENLDSLSNHVSKDHSLAGEAGLFYCKWNNCSRGSRGFNARYKMLVHVRTHTNEKPHQCCQCNKSFSRAENLKIHCRSHTGERPYVCTVPGCGKAYSNSSDRFKHSRTHTVEKPYICKIPGCSKRYTDPSSLRKHVKTYKHYESNAAKVAETTSEVSVEDSSSRSINDNIPQKNLNEQSACFTLAEDQTHTKDEKLLLTSFPPSRPIYYSVLSPHFTSRCFADNDVDKYADNSLMRHSILYSYSTPRNWVQLETESFPCIEDNVEPLDLSMNNNCIAY